MPRKNKNSETDKNKSVRPFGRIGRKHKSHSTESCHQRNSSKQATPDQLLTAEENVQKENKTKTTLKLKVIHFVGECSAESREDVMIPDGLVEEEPVPKTLKEDIKANVLGIESEDDELKIEEVEHESICVQENDRFNDGKIIDEFESRNLPEIKVDGEMIEGDHQAKDCDDESDGNVDTHICEVMTCDYRSVTVVNGKDNQLESAKNLEFEQSTTSSQVSSQSTFQILPSDESQPVKDSTNKVPCIETSTCSETIKNKSKLERNLDESEKLILESLYGNKNLLQIQNLSLDVIVEETSDCEVESEKRQPTMNAKKLSLPFLPMRMIKNRNAAQNPEQAILMNTKIIETETNIPEVTETWKTLPGDSELEAELVYLSSKSSSATDLSDCGGLTDIEEVDSGSENTETNLEFEEILLQALKDETPLVIKSFKPTAYDYKIETLEEDFEQTLDLISEQEEIEYDENENKSSLAEIRNDPETLTDSDAARCDKNDDMKTVDNQVAPAVVVRTNSSDSLSSSDSSQCTIATKRLETISPLIEASAQSFDKNDLTFKEPESETEIPIMKSNQSPTVATEASFVKLSPNLDRLDEESWFGLRSSKTPDLMVALSPTQTNYMVNNQEFNTNADELLDMHKKFVQRRAYHETYDELGKYEMKECSIGDDFPSSTLTLNEQESHFDLQDVLHFKAEIDTKDCEQENQLETTLELEKELRFPRDTEHELNMKMKEKVEEILNKHSSELIKKLLSNELLQRELWSGWKGTIREESLKNENAAFSSKASNQLDNEYLKLVPLDQKLIKKLRDNPNGPTFFNKFEDTRAYSNESFDTYGEDEESGESQNIFATIFTCSLLGVTICLCGLFIGKLLITQRHKFL